LIFHSSILYFFHSFFYSFVFFLRRTPPVAFESKFLEAYPDLHERLSKAPPGMYCKYKDLKNKSK
jgi:hypothetical protein